MATLRRAGALIDHGIRLLAFEGAHGVEAVRFEDRRGNEAVLPCDAVAYGFGLKPVAETVLGSPDRKTRQILWYLVVATLTAADFVFGSMAFVLVYQKKAAEAPLALATAALGAIVGLVATSPGSRGSG